LLSPLRDIKKAQNLTCMMPEEATPTTSHLGIFCTNPEAGFFARSAQTVRENSGMANAQYWCGVRIAKTCGNMELRLGTF